MESKDLFVYVLLTYDIDGNEEIVGIYADEDDAFADADRYNRESLFGTEYTVEGYRVRPKKERSAN